MGPKWIAFVCTCVISIEKKGRASSSNPTEERESETKSHRHAPVAVIWRAPHRNDGLVKHELVSVHGQLMCSRDEVNSIIVRKRFCDIGAEEITRTSR